MKNQALSLASIIVGGLSFGAAGCILGSNPNENSMLYNGVAGATGSAGTNGGAGGNGGSGFDPNMIAGTALATYDTTTESFAFSNYVDPAGTNLFTNGGSPTLEWDGDDGSPSGGSLKVYAPYASAGQYVDIQSKSFAPDFQNWTGGKLHVRIKVDAGSSFMGQIEPYADTGILFKFVGTSINAMAGNAWRDYVVTLDTAMTRTAGFDLKQVIVYGVHISGGTAPVTFHIDTFSIEGIAAPAADAGTDTTASADTGT